MNFHFLKWHFTFTGHIYSPKYQYFHDCNVTDCPHRTPPDKTKFVIADRIRGSYSERFDTKQDVERALRFFAPFSTTPLSHQYEILEATKVFEGQWMIGDPQFPPDRLYFLNTRGEGTSLVVQPDAELDPDV